MIRQVDYTLPWPPHSRPHNISAFNIWALWLNYNIWALWLNYNIWASCSILQYLGLMFSTSYRDHKKSSIHIMIIYCIIKHLFEFITKFTFYLGKIKMPSWTIWRCFLYIALISDFSALFVESVLFLMVKHCKPCRKYKDNTYKNIKIELHCPQESYLKSFWDSWMSLMCNCVLSDDEN